MGEYSLFYSTKASLQERYDKVILFLNEFCLEKCWCVLREGLDLKKYDGLKKKQQQQQQTNKIQRKG